ncbi:late secretory pathway protein avl9, partial [Ascosphaera aggregata]
MKSSVHPYTPSVLVVGFHHARGPEIELCISNNALDHIDQDDCALLPFMALSDGAHLSTEDFSYFTLRQSPTETEPAVSIFGISCIRQLDSNLLINRPDEVTRSTVQKAVVVLIREPRQCGLVRERLSVVTTAWFAQRDFTDVEILRRFHDSLVENVGGLNRQPKNESLGMSDWIVNARRRNPLTVTPGLSLREMIHEFKHNTLVLFKCLLLQPKLRTDSKKAKHTKDKRQEFIFLESALALTAADRRWINLLTQTINDTWDDAHPEQPKTHGYLGSEEFIRLQFEEYLLALLSSM